MFIYNGICETIKASDCCAPSYKKATSCMSPPPILYIPKRKKFGKIPQLKNIFYLHFYESILFKSLFSFINITKYDSSKISFFPS